MAGADRPAWLRVDAGAYRPEDGLLVPIVEGVAGQPVHAPLPAAEQRLALDALQPARARPSSLLAGQARALALERWLRLGRWLACGLLGLTVLAPGRRSAALGALSGLLYLGLEAALRLAALRGQLPPVWGGMGAAGLLTLIETRRYSTWIQ